MHGKYTLYAISRFTRCRRSFKVLLSITDERKGWGNPMEYIITSIGVLILVIAVAFVTMPALLKRFIEFAKVGKRCYLGGVVRIVFGGLLLIASPHASFFWIPVLVGILLLLSGIAIFVLGPQRIHLFLDWLYEKTDNQLRIPPVIAGLLAALLIYSA